jgi:hypothetical protein
MGCFQSLTERSIKQKTLPEGQGFDCCLNGQSALPGILGGNNDSRDYGLGCEHLYDILSGKWGGSMKGNLNWKGHCEFLVGVMGWGFFRERRNSIFIDGAFRAARHRRLVYGMALPMRARLAWPVGVRESLWRETGRADASGVKC